MPLEVPAYNGQGGVQVAHGDRCVSVVVTSQSGQAAGAVLTPDDARALAVILGQQADHADTVAERERAAGGD